MPRRPRDSAGQDVSIQSLDESIGFLLNESSRLSRRLLYGRLAAQGLRGGTWYVLRVLWEGDGMTQRELSKRLGTTQPSTLEMLRTMEREDLIRFERDPDDRRKTRVYLTDRAWKLKDPLLHVAEESTRLIVQALSPAEEVALRILLRTVRDTMAAALARENDEVTAEEGSTLELQPAAAPRARRRSARIASGGG